MKVQVYSSSEPPLEYNQNQMNQEQFERNQDMRKQSKRIKFY